LSYTISVNIQSLYRLVMVTPMILMAGGNMFWAIVFSAQCQKSDLYPA